jgi:hypothetical protein
MNCDKYKNQISRLVDGELDGKAKMELESHLKVCRDCDAYKEKLISLAKLAGSVKLQGDDKYWAANKDAIMEKIARAESGKDKIIEIPKCASKANFYRIAAVAASIAIVAIISIYESLDIDQIGPKLQRMESQEKAIAPSPTEIQESATEPMSVKMDEAKEGEAEAKKENRAAKDKKAGKEVAVDKKEPSESPGPAQVSAPIEQAKEVAGEVIERPEAAIKKEIAPEPAGTTKDEALYAPAKEPEARLEISSDRDTYKARLRALESPATKVIKSTTALSDSIKMTEGLTLDSAGRSGGTDEEYFFWLREIEYLKVRYAELLSGHYQESAAKKRETISEDSLKTILLKFAEAYYNLGLSARNREEKEAAISELGRLEDKSVDSVMNDTVKKYIDNLKKR